MAGRLYDSAAIAKSYAEFRPSHPLEVVSRIMEFHRKHSGVNHTEKLDLMVDVGCGSGQVSKLFPSYFQKIVGVDVSAEQLKQAKENCDIENISFVVGSAENIPAADRSVDLITSGFAAHYFDLPKFFAESKRVLKPSGCIALFATQVSKINLIGIDVSELPENIAQISANVMTDFIKLGLPEDAAVRNSVLDALDHRYGNLFEAIPFEIKERQDDIHNKFPHSLSSLQGLIRSIGFSEVFKKIKTVELKSKGQEVLEEDVDLSVLIVNKLKDLWNLHDFPTDQKVAQIDMHYFLLLAKV